MNGETISQPMEVLSFRQKAHELIFESTPIPVSQRQKEKHQESSFFDKITGLFSSKEEKPIEIFTIAGGKDYERTVKVLMYSVKKHTKHSVRFWLIEDYLSPQGRIVIKEFGKKIGIKVEYIRYHWPYDMFKQVSKTRIIWANKILFLDTMFPQDIDRIIFMDADQVTRTDSLELWNMDIHNHSIAMTPFCSGVDANKETFNLRFWNKQSWTRALKGKPYHISALFIADLAKIRERNIGGFYRSMYNNMAPDPNNLANLDQDLPNYVQHDVPIYSLSHEWLWCESWCNGVAKKKAKTIDLCNNPLHPMTKIESALENIEEWKDYDSFIHSLEEQKNEL